MAAIITNDIRVHNANQFVEQIGETANTVLYTFVGQPSSIAANAAVDNVTLTYDIHDNMIALKKVTSSDIVLGLRKYTWTTGNVYTAYDQDSANLYSTPFYVINSSDNGVYKCLANNNGAASTVAPTVQAGITTGNTTLLSDGYRWKHMFTITSADLAKFGTPSFIPCTTDASVSAAAISGGILNVRVVNGGSGYASAPNVAIIGDGSGANVVCNLSGGAVANVTVVSVGSNYRFANLVVTGGGGGSGANLKAIISPPGGHGFDANVELNAIYSLINTRLETTDVAFPTGITYYQVGLIRDPQLFGTTTIATASTLKNYKTMVLSAGYANPLYQGNVLYAANGSNAYLLAKDASVTSNIYFVQNRTGSSSNLSLAYRPFVGGVAAYVIGVGGSIGTISYVANSDIKSGSGRILYVDNRAAITRQSNQAESITIVLEF